MKRSLVAICVLLLVLATGAGFEALAGTYATAFRTTNPDSVQAFDGSFVDGTGALLWCTLNAHADTARLTVKFQSNVVRVIERLNLAAGKQAFAWDGKDAGGKLVAGGRYSFEVFTSDTGNPTTSWSKAWQNSVYTGTGIGLGSRDIDVVNDPMSPYFGNLIMTEATATYGYARMLMTDAAGNMITEFGRANYPAPFTDVNPWYLNIAKNNNVYVTASDLHEIHIYRDLMLVSRIKDTLKFKNPRGIATWGTGTPTVYVASGRGIVRILPSGAKDTLMALDTTGGKSAYVRDIAVDDEGYVYATFSDSAGDYRWIMKMTSAGVRLDTIRLPARGDHLVFFYGANRASASDDQLFVKVRGFGIYKVDFATKSAAQTWNVYTGTSSNHSMAFDMMGNLYYANPSSEYCQMFIPPQAPKNKMTTAGGKIFVSVASTKLIDGFEAGRGHFGVAPTYSGSTVGISTSSSAMADTTDGHFSKSSMQITILDDPASTTNWGVRFLSGIGTPASNDSVGAVGFIGFWLKTKTAPMNAQVSIGIDDPADPVTKRAVPKMVYPDGQWHLYQWNIADSTQWTAWVVTSGSPKIKGPRASIDAVWFFGADGSDPWTANFDDVMYNGDGPIGYDMGTGDVTMNGTLSALDASWILQYAVQLRAFDSYQLLVGDVNLSGNGQKVDASDASYVLASVVGKIGSLPFKAALPGGLRNVEANKEAPISIAVGGVGGHTGQLVTIPIAINPALAGLRSAEMKMSYDPAVLKIRNITNADLTKEFEVASNIANGSALIAMAAGDELKAGGQIILVEAELLRDVETSIITLTGIQLNGIAVASVTSVGTSTIDAPTSYELLQNYPNPFNPSTVIEYRLPANSVVDLKVYDVAGREVTTLVSGTQNAGAHQVTWNAVDASGNRVASGVYFYRLTAGSFTQMKKMMLLK